MEAQVRDVLGRLPFEPTEDKRWLKDRLARLAELRAAVEELQTKILEAA